MNIFTQFFKRADSEGRKQAILQDLMRREADLTRDIFGEVPKGARREFFCLDKSTWIWYEEWQADDGQYRQVTTRYIVRPTEILKSQNGGPYYRLTVDEALNFQKAVKAYNKRIKTQMYAQKSTALK